MQLHSLLTSKLDGSEWAKIKFGEKYDVNMQAHAQSSIESTLKMRQLLWHKCIAGIYTSQAVTKGAVSCEAQRTIII